MSGSSGQQRVPHYAEPTITSVLPTYLNEEQDMIRNAFHAGNFRSMHMLPNEMRANYVNEARANHMDANITSAFGVAPFGSYRVAGKDGPRGLFQEFEYAPEPSALADELKAQEKAEEAASRGQSTNVQTFYYTNANPSANKPEFDYDNEMQYQDPFDVSQNEDMRRKWLEKSKILHGPFRPSQQAQGLCKPTRAHVPDIMRSLAGTLDQDWDDAEYQVFRDEEDLIIIEFELSSLDSVKGLQAYMNILEHTNDIISSHGLSKVVELWNHEPGDGSVYYAFKPPWVKRSSTDSYYVLHPDRRSFRTQMEYEGRRREKTDMPVK
jgi:hypothetical protein